MKAQSTVERRASTRLRGPLAAFALDVPGDGAQLGTPVVLDNLGVGGFYLRTARPLEEGEPLLVVTRISQAVVVLRGSVLRVEPQPDGTRGLAVAVTQHQIFSLTDASEKLRRVPSPLGT